MVIDGRRGIPAAIFSCRLPRPEASLQPLGGLVGEAALHGGYLFSADPPNSSGELLRRELRTLGGGGGVLVWMASDAGRRGSRILRFDSAQVVTADLELRSGGLAVRIPAGSRLRRDRERDLLAVTGAGILGAVAPGEPARPVDEITIDRSGRLAFRARLEEGLFDPSIRYFYGSPLLRLIYPIFEHGTATSLAQASLDPTHPEDTAGNHLVVDGDEVRRTGFRTPLGHPIGLAPVYPESRYAWQWDPVEEAQYAVLEGNWKLSVLPPEAPAPGSDLTDVQVMCGLSGVELALVPEGSFMRFRTGGGAFAPDFGKNTTAAGQPRLVSSVEGSAYPVTTSRINFVVPDSQSDGPSGLDEDSNKGLVQVGEPGPPGYYTQPNRSSFYETDPVHPEFLWPLEVRAGGFPAATTPGFPMVPYAGVTPDETGATSGAYRQFELTILGPTRREVILPPKSSGCAGTFLGIGLEALGAPPGPVGLDAGFAAIGATGSTGPVLCPTAPPPGPTLPVGPTGPVHLATSSRGLLAGFDVDDGRWRSLTVARTAGGKRTLQITEIRDNLKNALLANELFLVITDPCRFLENASINYKLTTQSLLDLETRAEVPPRIVDRVWYLKDIVYESLPYFEHVLLEALGECAFEEWGQDFIAYGAFAELQIEDWSFDLSPYLWEMPGRSLAERTIQIFKFADRPLVELVDDLSLWTLPESFNEKPSLVREALKLILAQAEERAVDDPDYRYFVHTVAGIDAPGVPPAPAWNGVLWLNAFVPLTRLPDELQGLAAGIDPSLFRAHHLGVDASSLEYDGHNLGIQDSSLFGLIDYQDLDDLLFDGTSFQYKVLVLKVLFQSSLISSFSSQVELLVGRLFDELATLPVNPHGNNVIFFGTLQRHGDEASYVFLTQETYAFDMSSQVLDKVDITQGQFVTVVPDAGFEPGQLIETRFQLWGDLKFRILTGFDAFSFGPSTDGSPDGSLRYSNLSIDMSFRQVGDMETTFVFDTAGVVFDLARSLARPESLYSRFPLQLNGLVTGTADTTPEGLGFIPVDAPTQLATLTYPWWGLEMQLNLGTPGGLAGKLGFMATLLLAWSPAGENDVRVSIGIQLPGSEGRKEIRVQGPLKLTIGDILLTATTDGQGYLMRFANVALSFFSLRFPPGGQTNILLFGDPDPASSASSLGWYAAYKKDQKKDADTTTNAQGDVMLGGTRLRLVRIEDPAKPDPAEDAGT